MICLVPCSTEHLDAISAIEQQCFDAPWGLESLMRTITGQHAVTLVALDGDKPIGYAAALLIAPEAEVLKVAVHPSNRGDGTGRMLADALTDKLKEAGATTMHLEVRESNRAARILYETCGFRQIGVRSSYYTSPAEDAVLMRKDI